MKLPPYNPAHINTYGLGYTRFARRYSGHRKNLLLERNGANAPCSRVSRCIASAQKENSVYCFLFLQVLRCFTSLGTLPTYVGSCAERRGFPHSDTPGSKTACPLAEAHRRQPTAPSPSYNLGIHHTPLHSCKECCTPHWSVQTKRYASVSG